MRRVAHPIALLMLCFLTTLAFVAACGGGDDDGPSDAAGTPSPSASAPDSGESPAPTASPSDATPTAAASGAGAQLRALIQDWFDGVDAKVTYNYKSNFGGHPDGVYTTYYLDGSSRHDWENIGAGFGVTVVTIVDGDDGYVCSINESNPNCEIRSPEDAASNRVAFLIIPTTLEAISDRVGTLAVKALPDEEIAGLTATCYETTTTGERITEGPPAVEVVTTCFSPDSILLKVDHDVFFEDETLPDGDLLLEATDVSQPTGSDFDPPARVVNG